MESLAAIVPLVFGVLLFVTGALAAMERLPRNDWVGLRLHDVMKDEESWRAGHKAGAAWLVAGGLVDVAGGILLCLYEDVDAASGVVPLLVVAVVAYTIAAWRAQAAARRRS